MLYLKGENDMCIYCNRELKGVHEHSTGVCAFCDEKMKGKTDPEDDDEDLDPYENVSMEPDPKGRTSGDVSDR